MNAEDDEAQYTKCSEAYTAWRKTKAVEPASQEENRIAWVSFYAGWRAVQQLTGNSGQ